MTIFFSPKVFLTTVAISVKAVGPAVFPREDPDRDGAAFGAGEQPVLDLDVAFLPSRE